MPGRIRPKSEAQFVHSIQKLVGRTGPALPELILPIGDDAAAFQPSKGSLLLVSSDALIEGIHFQLNYFSPGDLGWKALAVNLSDIAAMGGTPRLFTTSLAIPPTMSRHFLHRFYQGMLELAQKAGVALAGGDTCASRKDFFLDVTILGEVPRKQLIPRSGAQPGDILFVTGELGGSAIGLEFLQRGLDLHGKTQYLKRHLRPVPRLDVGRWLGKNRLATAMIDLSDGLSIDLHRLLTSSGVGARLQATLLPPPRFSRKLASMLSHSLLHYLLHGGEDYELLFSVPPHLKHRIPAERDGVRISEIGVITSERGKCWLSSGGQTTRLYPAGYDHFQER
jgi:thiamine-monophosphate kinase